MDMLPIPFGAECIVFSFYEYIQNSSSLQREMGELKMTADEKDAQ
jgi:hypothetical protein